MAILRYRNFDLRLRRAPQSSRRYVVQTDDGEEHRFDYPFTRVGEVKIELKVARSSVASRRADTNPRSNAIEVGGALYKCLLSGKIAQRWEQERALAERQNHGLRLRIRCGDAPELFRLPWEYIWDDQRREHLATSERTPIVRCLDADIFAPRLTAKSPLRVLVAIAQPNLYPALGSLTEIGHLRNGYFEVVPVRGASTLHGIFKEVTAAEKAGKPFHIFHFIGHGQFNSDTNCGELLFEGEGRAAQPCNATELGTIFRTHRALRLAVINACEGGVASQENKFDGFVQGLVQQGIPAAIGMQYEIPDEIAIDFAESFYKSLGSGTSLEAALAEARRGIYAVNGMEWAVPVVYAHPQRDRLFSFRKSSVVPPEIPKEKPAPQNASGLRIVRPNEEALIKMIATPAASIIVSAPGGFGRTTQLKFLADTARQAGKRPVWIDFSEIAEEAFAGAESFFREFARCFARRFVGQDAAARKQIDQIWAASEFDGNVLHCGDFIQQTLESAGSPSVCLLLDNVDRLLGTEFQADFFRLFKVWESERHDARFAWSKMDVILATSEEPWCLNLRNFQEAHLPPFDEEQSASLSKHYQSGLSKTYVRALCELLGGHPELMHLCLSHSRPEGNSKSFPFSVAQEPLFSKLDSLRTRLMSYEKKKRLPLTASLREIQASKRCTDDGAFYQLRVLGIVGRSRHTVSFTCPLYSDYFRD